MLEILIAGGPAMIPILLCSAVALAIILERFWSLRRRTVVPPELGEQVLAWARTRKLDPAHIETLRTNSPLGEILAARILNHSDFHIPNPGDRNDLDLNSRKGSRRL